MATINPVYGGQLIIKLGNGATPEVFARTAMINTSRGIEFTANTESSELIDLDDHMAPAVTYRMTSSVDSKIDGAGVVSKDHLEEWLDWATSGQARNVEITLGVDGPTYRGSYICTTLSVSGERVATCEFNCTLEQAGPVVKQS